MEKVRCFLVIEGGGASDCGRSLRGANGAIDLGQVLSIPTTPEVPINDSVSGKSLGGVCDTASPADARHLDERSSREAIWGTPSNVFDVIITKDREDLFTAMFSCLSVPPLPVVGEMASRYHDLKFAISYSDEVNWLVGLTEYSGGRKTYAEELHLELNKEEGREYLQEWSRNGVRMPGEIPGQGFPDDINFTPRLYEPLQDEVRVEQQCDELERAMRSPEFYEARPSSQSPAISKMGKTDVESLMELFDFDL